MRGWKGLSKCRYLICVAIAEPRSEGAFPDTGAGLVAFRAGRGGTTAHTDILAAVREQAPDIAKTSYLELLGAPLDNLRP
jgi:hypothetical protein